MHADVSQIPGPDAPRPVGRGEGATITPYVDGPLIVRGDFRLVDADGTEIDPGRGTVALCRCGKSALKPFCDGSHVRAGFRAGSRPSRKRPSERLAEADDAQPAERQG